MSVPAFRRGSADAPVAQTARPASAKPNRYGAKCTECDGWVEAEAGLLTKDATGNWAAKHIECPQPAETPSVSPVDADFTPNVFGGFVLRDGTYTLTNSLGEHRTFRLKTQRDDDDFMPGAQIIQFLSGPNNERDYTSFGHIRNSSLSVWKKHRDNTDLMQAVRAFLKDPSRAEMAANCYRCGHLLTTPESIATGWGPECSKRGLS